MGTPNRRPPTLWALKMYIDSQFEKERFELQERLDALKSQDEKNRLGQFATPIELAQQILSQSIDLLSSKQKIRFLDPAFGTGAFYSALLTSVSPKRITHARGFELDRHYGIPAQRLWIDTALNIDISDFTKTHPPSNDSDRFNLIVCNPPYVRHHHLSNADKLHLKHAVKSSCGLSINGLSGLYCYFILLSHVWMSRNALAVWLVPSEFMDVNYGKPVKHYLKEKVTLIRIHRFDPNDLQFNDALVSSAVIWFRNQKPSPDHHVNFTFGGTLQKPNIQKKISLNILQEDAKWSHLPKRPAQKKSEALALGDLFKIKRGIATGSNKFFILSKEQIITRSLPMECFHPILPSPRYLKSDEVVCDSDGNPQTEPHHYLLDCRLSEHEIKIKYPTLSEYLQTGKPVISERYLCTHRKPWYSQEYRPPAPILFTYIGRLNTKRGRPFRFILNNSKATAPNVYLMLYPKSFLSFKLRHQPGLLRQIWVLLNQIDIPSLLQEGRVYGGGLHKLEPKELARVSAFRLMSLIPEAPVDLGFQMKLFV